MLLLYHPRNGVTCCRMVSFTSYLDGWVLAQRLHTSIPSQLAPESVCRSVKPFQSSVQKAIESTEACTFAFAPDSSVARKLKELCGLCGLLGSLQILLCDSCVILRCILLQRRQQVLIVLRHSRLILLIDSSDVLGVSGLSNGCSVSGRVP